MIWSVNVYTDKRLCRRQLIWATDSMSPVGCQRTQKFEENREILKINDLRSCETKWELIEREINYGAIKFLVFSFQMYNGILRLSAKKGSIEM